MATRIDNLPRRNAARHPSTEPSADPSTSAGLFRRIAEEALVQQPPTSPPASVGSRKDDWQRALDIALSLVCLLIVAPVMAAAALLVFLSGPGPIMYSHQRLGRNGTVFGCLKFRTMRKDADKVLQELLRSSPVMMAEWAAERKLRHDPRITPIGRFLRRYSIDELPQFINVLRGEMSIVGPRPLAIDEAQQYADAYALCFSVNPGITGLWQVSGRNEVSYNRRVALDCEYARARCLKMDLWIIFRTVPVVLGGTGH